MHPTFGMKNNKKEHVSKKRNRPDDEESRKETPSVLRGPKQLISLQLRFRQACEQGNLPQVNRLMPVDVAACVHGFLAACKAGHLDIVQILIDKGILKKKKGKSQIDQACTLACTHGHAAIVELLFRNNIRMSNEKCLRLGIEHGQLPIVKFAIAKGAVDIYKATLQACRSGYLEILEFLYGIAPCGPTHLYSMMNTACQCGHLSIVSFLITRFTPQSETDWFDWTDNACSGGYVDVIQCILQHIKSNSLAIHIAQYALDKPDTRVNPGAMVQLCDLQVLGWTPMINRFVSDRCCETLVHAGFTASMFTLPEEARKVDSIVKSYSQGLAQHLSLYLISDVIGIILPFLFRSWPLSFVPPLLDQKT